MNYCGEKARLKFTESILQQKLVTYIHKKVVNLYVVYKITNFHGIDNYPTLTNALFGAVKLTKNADIDKYKFLDMELDLTNMDFSHILLEELEEI